MRTKKHVAESAENTIGAGRIAPVNMASETNGLSYDSLTRDMTEANEWCPSRCQLWACAAVRG